jgi:hypothetical protein
MSWLAWWCRYWIKGAFAAVEGLPVVLIAERRDDQVQADSSLPPDAFFVFG